MIELLVALAVTFVVVSFMGQVMHWVLHQKWSGFMNETHMEHHLVLYPMGSLVSEKYKTAGKRSGTFVFTIALSPLLLTPFVLGLLGVLTWPTTLACFGLMVGYGLLNDAIHDSFHITRSVWRWWPGYKRLRRLHLLHHNDMTKNYGIFMFVWDKLFRTYQP